MVHSLSCFLFQCSSDKCTGISSNCHLSFCYKVNNDVEHELEHIKRNMYAENENKTDQNSYASTKKIKTREGYVIVRSDLVEPRKNGSSSTIEICEESLMEDGR
ncbi:uncharacterized protein LOC134222978 [Armigeres subalbatus]|uniref:uncharacterized protein LOC134222978 n=1 Tax=Armigeres subalbatus TaxID=124917 RepID=UPI002ED67C73